MNFFLNKKIFQKVFFIFLLSFLLFSSFDFIQASTTTSGIVPCGLTSAYSDRCTLCHLLKGIDNIVKWGRNVLVVVAMVAIVAGGIMYIISAGNSGAMESAKGVIKQALIGVVIVLGAWVIVSTVLWLIASRSNLGVGVSNWYNFECDSSTSGNVGVHAVVAANNDGTCNSGYSLTSTGSCMSNNSVAGDANAITNAGTETNAGGNSLPIDNGAGTTTPATIPSTVTTDTAAVDGVNDYLDGKTGADREAAVRDLLDVAGISINRNNACQAGQTSGCTDVGNLRTETIVGIGKFFIGCGSNCQVVVTGGSEGNGIHKETGTYNHINGYKVDVRPTAEIDDYIQNNSSFTKIPELRDGKDQGYIDAAGNTYYREGDHWDVTYFK